MPAWLGCSSTFDLASDDFETHELAKHERAPSAQATIFVEVERIEPPPPRNAAAYSLTCKPALAGVGAGNTRAEASEACCKQMVANMLAVDPEAFEFDPETLERTSDRCSPTGVRRAAACRLARTLCAISGIKRWCLQSGADPTTGAQA